LLKEAGFDGPPKTVKEMKQYAEKLSVVKEEGRLERLGLWPGTDPYTFAYVFNGKFYDPDKNEVTPEDAFDSHFDSALSPVSLCVYH